ncbi:hypothetical protein [Brachymonas denitrificans]|jgi:heme O synthase-like polyprenyltransferase|uniref:Uncharacterized protein n=1 Tax=Brachymonas denitrificans DSM 15123 TaxID=1121117 RepID=A0A1H8JDC7_9BURK|nr:hypothetical protein [Brachymonas denitrificans]SEN78177.1 hypothetical protein SAMN02745977_02026 [Brachymonas denitrificans DSM 15123]
MAIVRVLFILMLLVSAGTMGLYLFTGNERYKRQALRLFKWTIIVLCLFFAVLVIERI